MDKTCSKCGIVKSIDYFSRRSGYKDGIRSECISCVREYGRKRYSNPEVKRRQREQHLVKKFGIDQEIYDLAFKAQNGLCLICDKPSPGRWHVDHDHATGKFRGILCSYCNRGLGYFKDSKLALANAVLYLEKNGT